MGKLDKHDMPDPKVQHRLALLLDGKVMHNIDLSTAYQSIMAPQLCLFELFRLGCCTLSSLAQLARHNPDDISLRATPVALVTSSLREESRRLHAVLERFAEECSGKLFSTTCSVPAEPTPQGDYVLWLDCDTVHDTDLAGRLD
jgi:hypothetical protein